MHNYEELANAIIVQAVKDYRSARKNLKKDPCDKAARKSLVEIESFFSSDWIKILTNADGEMILRTLKEETVL